MIRATLCRLIVGWLIVAAPRVAGGCQDPLDEEDPYRAGLIATYDDHDGRVARRVDARIAMNWGDQPPDARLAPGSFAARWTGLFESQAPGSYQLFAYVEGQVSLKLAGHQRLAGERKEPGWVVSEPFELPYDYHAIEINYRRTGPRGRLALFWTGPRFQLEPVRGRHYSHDLSNTPADHFERGERLARALRCDGCHASARDPLPAPALDRVRGNMNPAWMVEHLTTIPPGSALSSSGARRMPAFQMPETDARAIAHYLINTSPDERRDEKQPPGGDASKGEHLALTTGCLACHRIGEFGLSGLFGGGDLSQVAAKRPADFFFRWLSDPAKINRDHAMPLFELKRDERADLAAYLATLAALADKRAGQAGDSTRDDDRGKALFQTYRCGGCHRSTQRSPAVATVTPLRAGSKWDSGCLTPVRPAPVPSAPVRTIGERPLYSLAESDARALRDYYSAVAPRPTEGNRLSGARLVDEHNCLACHDRDTSSGISAALPAIAERHTDLAAILPAMAPPALTSVGDKLKDAALAAAIRRQDPTRRPWLAVRMPKFRLTDDELQDLVAYFAAAERIPVGVGAAPYHAEPSQHRRLEIAGARLVTTDGFGCTSCHRIGDVEPPAPPLNAIAPDLTGLESRIRATWFDRWVRNPSRIVPRMEMPSVQLPVHGSLDDDLDEQLAAVWHVLNQPGFQPPEPNPVRVLRQSGESRPEERAMVVTDVLRIGKQVLIKPLVIGLPNRHSVVFDLETNRLRRWTIGDVARQRTEGKTWYWELAGNAVTGSDHGDSELVLARGEQVIAPNRIGQFVTEFDWFEHRGGGLAFARRLHFDDGVVRVEESITPIGLSPQGLTGIRRRLDVRGIPPGTTIRWDIAPPDRTFSLASDGRSLVMGGIARGLIRVVRPGEGRMTNEGRIELAGPTASVVVEYLVDLPMDRYPVPPQSAEPPEAAVLNVVPGFEAVRLPIAEPLMPTALAWRRDGSLVVTSLKGRVWLARDTNGDGLEDQVRPFSDELAAPFGAAENGTALDVINKYALLRLSDNDGDGRADRTETVASGWGHTADYHDWAVGLPRDESGAYYIAMSCQQDDRSVAAAHWRGVVTRLVPRAPNADDPRAYSVELVSAGHRFPIGIARRADDGELFVTDNQGNYNPFNELNHVRRGRRYGFINAVEQQKKNFDPPPLTPPAIDIPHPWTRSVNGLCFLETPAGVRARDGARFGPFEGHLVGCEYDTRRLVRLSLQTVDGVIQGAAYPFSYDEPPAGEPLLGPLACAVSPEGDLYVGSIRDSGWGGGNNIGTLVRLRMTAETLPAGIAEVRAVPGGLEIDFTRPVDREKARRTENYSLASFTRVSTPAYGGDDVDRSVRRITAVQLADDARSVVLTLDKLQANYVYELHVKNVGAASEFHPDLAYYTMRKVPLVDADGPR